MQIRVTSIEGTVPRLIFGLPLLSLATGGAGGGGAAKKIIEKNKKKLNYGNDTIFIIMIVLDGS